MPSRPPIFAHRPRTLDAEGRVAQTSAMDRPTELPPSADALGEALHLLRLNGSVYARSELTAPWGIDLPPLEGHMMFHVVTAGRCWLETDGSEPLLLERGGLALVPHGLGHRLVDEPGRASVDFFDLPVERVTERYELLRWGGGGETCRLICVVVRFDHAARSHRVHRQVRLRVVVRHKANAELLARARDLERGFPSRRGRGRRGLAVVDLSSWPLRSLRRALYRCRVRHRARL